MNENTSFTRMVLLNISNDRTDHEFRLNKLRHNVDDVKLNAKKRLLFFKEILYKMRFVAKLKKNRQIRSDLVSTCFSRPNKENE